MTRVTFRISNVANRSQVVQERLPFATLDEQDVVIRSQVDEACPVNEHIVWLWGMLRHERRFLKNLKQNGAKLTCQCYTNERKLALLPNGAEMLHLLGCDLLVDTKRATPA